MSRLNNSAFSLIEVAVAIAIIAILAGAVAPLAMKALNQQREQKTRENLKIAFEAMFGSRDHRVANMRADFGFDPGALANLSQMTTSPGGLRPWSPDPGYSGLSWGWNGPYWTGSTLPAAGSLGIPIDGWGRPFQLNFTGGAWQLQSAGANGVMGGAVIDIDDIFYPTVAAPKTNYQCTLTVNVNRTNSSIPAGPLLITIAVRHRTSPGPPPLVTALVTVPPTPSLPYAMPKMDQQHWTYSSIVPGPVLVTVNGSEQIIDLMPGELRTLTFQFD